MSKIVWKSAMTPPAEVVATAWSPAVYDGKVSVPGVRLIPVATNEIKVPDPKIARSTSRAGMFLTSVCEGARDILKPYLDKDPYSVGIYCAVENGSSDYDSIKLIWNCEPEQFAETYKKKRNPKMYLKQLPNLAAAQMGIFLGIRGPMNVFNHSRLGAIQALEQAEFDVEHGIVEAALVCSAFAITEDPLLALRARKQAPHDTALAEGAAAVVMVRSGDRGTWSDLDKPVGTVRQYHGISQPIVHIVQEGV